MPDYNRISVMTSLVLIGLALFLIIELPTRSFAFAPLGSLLRLDITEAWVVGALLVGLACTGSDAVIRAHPRARRRRLRLTFVHWILPGLITLLAAMLLPHATSAAYWVGGLALTALLLILVVSAEYHVVDWDDPAYRTAQLGLSLAAYLGAAAFFALLYASRARSLVSATLTMVAGFLLALIILRFTRQFAGRITLYAAIVGLVLAEAMWALNYWPAPGLTAGLLLLLLFYVLTGIAQQHLLDRLTWRVAIEYGVVLAVGVMLICLWGR